MFYECGLLASFDVLHKIFKNPFAAPTRVEVSAKAIGYLFVPFNIACKKAKCSSPLA